MDIVGKILGHSPNVVQNYEWIKGKHEFISSDGKKSILYVNRGLGSHLSFRLFCRPEIGVITFKKETK